MPQWICPVCYSGVLKGNKDSLKLYKKEEKDEDYFDLDNEDEYLFMGFLICTSCKSRITVIGDAIDYQYLNINRDDEEYMATATFYYPKLFNPLCIFFK